MEDYFLALFISGNKIIPRVYEMLEPEDFAGEVQKRFFRTLRDIIVNSKPNTNSPGKLTGKMPSDLSGFIDQLYLVNISPAFSDEQLWAEELVKVAFRIKRRSLSRQLGEISTSLKVAQKASSGDKILKLTEKLSELSEKLKEFKEDM